MGSLFESSSADEPLTAESLKRALELAAQRKICGIHFPHTVNPKAMLGTITICAHCLDTVMVPDG